MTQMTNANSENNMEDIKVSSESLVDTVLEKL